MDRNYIIYNNRPFTLIWHLAFGAFGVYFLSENIGQIVGGLDYFP